MAKPVVVASTSIIGDWVAQVAADRVQLYVLMPPGSDLHSFEPVAGDYRLMSRADLVFEFGLGLESWLEPIYQSVPRQPRRVALARGFHLLRPGESLSVDENHPLTGFAALANGVMVRPHMAETCAAHTEHGAACHDGEYDPHVWFDPENARIMVAAIAHHLAAMDPAHAEQYFERAAAYTRELAALDTFINSHISTVPVERRQLVTNHDSFRYYARRYGLTIPTTLFGISTGVSDPSARSVAHLVRGLRQWQSPAVFAENTFNPALLRQIAREAGLPRPAMLYTGLSDASGPAGDYISMMQHNTRTIVSGLSPAPD